MAPRRHVPSRHSPPAQPPHPDPTNLPDGEHSSLKGGIGKSTSGRSGTASKGFASRQFDLSLLRLPFFLLQFWSRSGIKSETSLSLIRLVFWQVSTRKVTLSFEIASLAQLSHSI